MQVKNPQLNVLRGEWEKGMLVLGEKLLHDHFSYLVVLSDPQGHYHCHRYFRTGNHADANEWAVSVDVKTDDIAKAFKWAFEHTS